MGRILFNVDDPDGALGMGRARKVDGALVHFNPRNDSLSLEMLWKPDPLGRFLTECLIKQNRATDALGRGASSVAKFHLGVLSILAPIGTALIGYRVGDLVRWS